MSKERKKASKREILLATLTVVSTLLTVMGTATNLYANWQAAGAEAKKQAEALERAEAEDLLNHVEEAKQALPTCDLTSAERAEIDSVLAKVIKEVKVSGDIQAAKVLFESIQEKIVNCPLVTITTVKTTTVAPPVEPSSVYLVNGFLIVLALVAMISAVAWRREHRRNKTVP